MHLVWLFRTPLTFFVAVILLLSAQREAQGIISNERELSWLGFGETRASFSIQDHDLAVGLDGSQQELTFWQERNAKTNLFSGLHLINQEFSIMGGQSNSQTYDLEYRSLSLLYSVGYDLLIGDFLHIQPYAAYGLGQGSFRLAHTAKDGTQRAFPKKTGFTDIGAYGANILLEISKRFWIGFSQNYFLETRSFAYDGLGKTELQLEQSNMLLLIWNWNPVSSSIKLPVEFIRLEDLEG
jgi:hypothetical protein